MTLAGTCQDSHTCGSSALINLTYDGCSLRPLRPSTQELSSTDRGTRLLYAHHHEGMVRLITECQDATGQWRYEWVDGHHPGLPHPLTVTAERLNTVTAVGGILCLVREGDLLYAPWDATTEDYHLVSRSDLLYDLMLTQTEATTATITAALPATALRQNDGAKLLQAMDSAIDTRLAQMGDTVHKHITFGIAALRMFDGSITLCSNIFALIPPSMPQTITVDADAATMQCAVPLHRHRLTATMRRSDDVILSLVQSIDIFLTVPTSLLDPVSMQVTMVSDRPAVLSFSPLTTQATAVALGEMTFYKVMTIDQSSWATAVAIPRLTAKDEELDLTNLHRCATGGRHAYSYDRRLHLAATRQTIYCPLDIGIRYEFPTRDNNGGLLGGALPDTLGHGEGVMADVVMTLLLSDAPGKVARFSTQLPYPLPGMIMVPFGGAYHCQLHVHVTTEEGERYYVCEKALHSHPDKGFSYACYHAAGLSHNTLRPSFLSLLYQQARVVYHDPSDDSETVSYLLWQEESAEEFETEAAQASDQWLLDPHEGTICSSAPEDPFVLPTMSHTRIGGSITGIATNTRRTADGQFGDSQYYFFTDEGVWVLKMDTAGKWKAHHALSRDMLSHPSAMAVTDQAVVFMSQRGILHLRGTVTEVLSSSLQGDCLCLDKLPRIKDILAAVDGPVATSFVRGINGLTSPRLLYDSVNQLVIVYDSQEIRQDDDDSSPSCAFVYAMASSCWSVVDWSYHSAITHGNEVWVMNDDDSRSHLMRLSFPLLDPCGEGYFTGQEPVTGEAEPSCDGVRKTPVLLCSSPLALGKRHVAKRIRRLEITGRMSSPIHDLGTALYGSNDLVHWFLTGASIGCDLEPWHGTPFRWYRVIVTGKMALCERIEGAKC